MSADNWTTCPRCTSRLEARFREREAEVQAAYGSVAVEEFDRMRQSLSSDQAIKPAHTFREDYEFWGAEDGVVHAAYRGSCSECSLTVKFDHEQTFFPEVPA